MSGTDHDVDLWSEVIGQADAVDQLRAAATSPVHAYLIVGPEGSGKRAAARAFAADLLAAGLLDDEAERARRLVGAEAHPALTVVEREGASITKEQADEVVRQSSLAPPEGALQVIVLVDFHLVGVAAPKLLKSIEEPPPTTVFVVLAEEITPELVTIASRCVQVDLAAVPQQVLVDRLVADGVDPEAAGVAASGAGGSLSPRPTAGARPGNGVAARCVVRRGRAPRRHRCDRSGCGRRAAGIHRRCARAPRGPARRGDGAVPGRVRSGEPRTAQG